MCLSAKTVTDRSMKIAETSPDSKLKTSALADSVVCDESKDKSQCSAGM